MKTLKNIYKIKYISVLCKFNLLRGLFKIFELQLTKSIKQIYENIFIETQMIEVHFSLTFWTFSS